jgi:hypothetical protein
VTPVEQVRAAEAAKAKSAGGQGIHNDGGQYDGRVAAAAAAAAATHVVMMIITSWLCSCTLSLTVCAAAKGKDAPKKKK